MEKGKRLCSTLKELRKRIADANEIPFEMEACTHKGDCPGTCPKCEAEVQTLMDAIDKREKQGKPVVMEGLMSEEELRKVFSIEPVGTDMIEKHKEPEFTMGMLVPEAPVTPMGNIPVPLMGDICAPPSYDFAFTIAKELLAESKGNFVFSPAGLCSVLEMLREGMDESSDVYERVSSLILGFNNTIDTCKEENFQLEHAASLWYNQKLGDIKKEYIDILQDEYEAEVHHADFAQKMKTKLWIDKWVSDRTHRMIPKLNTELSEEALMLVLDAIYLNGKWKYPFDSDCTDTDIFYNADGSEAEVDMMYQNMEEAEYGETEAYQVINLPYKDSEYSMVVVLPKEGNCIEEMMADDSWQNIDLEENEVDLYMPRFKFNNTLSFKGILTNVGLGDMFDTYTCFPHVTDLLANISQIKQQCVIKVEEEGTEAAALTIVECITGCCPPDDIPETITMRLDRPFGFAIKGGFGELLFMGVVKNMNNSTI